MKVSDFMSPAVRLGKGKGRATGTYRTWRRNLAKLQYRRAKKDRRK